MAQVNEARMSQDPHENMNMSNGPPLSFIFGNFMDLFQPFNFKLRNVLFQDKCEHQVVSEALDSASFHTLVLSLR